MIPLLHFLISLCQWQVSNPCSLDFESGVPPLYSWVQPAAADTFASFLSPFCQLKDLNPWSLDCESSVLPLSYWHKLYVIFSFLMSVAGLELSVLRFELSVLPLCYQGTTLCGWYFFIFHSLSANGKFQTVALWILSLVFYHCAPGHSLLLLIPFGHSLSPVSIGRFQTLDLWFVNKVFYHCASSTGFLSFTLSWCQCQDWNYQS